MPKYCFRIVVIIILLSACAGIGSANSLWDDSESMYTDNIAFRRGDILTVNITESSSANQQASTDLSQTNQANVGAGTGILNFIKSLGYNQSDSNSASGTTTRSGSLNADMTVKVVEKTTNGNLKIAGTKELDINGEKQQIEITGFVRPADIEPDNTVESQYLANVNIKYSGRGIVGDKQDPGIISRILNWLF